MTDQQQKPRPGRPRATSDPDQVQRLLDAAMTVFIEKGFGRATTTDVSRCAGMSKRDLYARFEDKTDLFKQVIRSRRHLVLDLPRPQGEDLPPLDALRRIFRLDLEDRAAAERDALMHLIARESLMFPEMNALLYDTGVIRFREMLMDWLDALLPRRQLKGPVDRAKQAKDIMDRIAIILRGLRSEETPDRSTTVN
ncbi:TetR/AcrR family transcriptional regulator [Nitratireductor aquibiodomus]|uniref:TetR/AcrR family transcriptional regulator n=1 Tax=Nitratireductor aquibiodomus TaxID=204799 RepID=UPI00046877E6|nr:TetR/AcrR family transcriptional regulator [Nitratireductor aquibiodomus]